MDTLTIVQNKRDQSNQLHKRQDSDAKLAHLGKYKLKSALDGKDIPGAVSITLNKPAVYLHSVVSWILNAKWQTFVEGNIASTMKTDVENFLDDAYAESDERRIGRGEKSSRMLFATHLCSRGWIGRRLLWQADGENVYLDDVFIDMRWAEFEPDNVGFKWVAPTYWRSTSILQRQYPSANIPDSKDLFKVTDFWDGEKNEVWVADKLVSKEKNEMGYPPFIILPSPSGFVFLDKGYMKDEGESIFFLDRDLYDPQNQLVSVDQTLAMQAVDPNYQRELLNRKGDSPSPGASGGRTLEVEPGSKYELMPQSDIKMSNRIAHEEIGRAVEQGSLSEVDIATPPRVTSALWITEQTELRNKLLVPLLQTLENFSAQSSRMLIDMYKKGGYDSYVGVKGKATKYKATKLGDLDDYTIKYRLMSKNRKQEIANVIVSNAAVGEMSRISRLENIMMVDEPEVELARIEAEEAEQFDPVVKMIRLVCSTIDRADKLHGIEAEQKYHEARRLASKCIMLIEQERNAPQMQNEVQQRKSQENKQSNINAMMGVSAMGNENLTGGI